MSRSALCCGSCGYRLAWQRPNGKLRVEPDVLVVRFAAGRTVLTCPACGALTWQDAADLWLVPPRLRAHAV